MATSVSPQNVGKLHTRPTLITAGALCSLIIGSGFATGQEALQYFASHGWWGIAGALVVGLIFAWLFTTLIEWGRLNAGSGKNAFVHYCGRYVGTALKWIVPLFLFAVVATMVAGAGALVNEEYGAPVWVGAAIISVMIGVTLLLGLARLVNIVASIGPVKIVFLIFITVVVLAVYADGLGNATQSIEEYAPPTATEAWWSGAVLYGVSIMLTTVPFLAGLGATLKGRTASSVPGSLLGAACVTLVLILETLALLATMDKVADKATPLPVLGSDLSPAIGIVFSIVIFLGIYSAGAALIWSVADQFTPKSSTNYKRNYTVFCIGLTVVAMIGGMTLPFGTLVGTLYPFAGYFGLVFAACVAARQIAGRFRRGSSAPAAAGAR